MISDWLTGGGFRSNSWQKMFRMIKDPSYIVKRMWNKTVFKYIKKLMWR